jgi:Spy/CpxP family protein refolding chaperone
MKHLNLKTIALLSLFIVGFTFAQAQKRGPGNGPHGNGCNMLDLSDEQQKKIDDLRTVHMKEMLPLRNELNEKRARLQTLRTAEKYDASATEKTLEEMSAVKLKMAKKREAHKQEVRSLLTEEQRIKFDMHKGRGYHGKGMKGNIGSRGKGYRADCPYGNR